MTATSTFEEQRRRLFGVAYRMLGTVMDTEDVVQDAWLRWRTVAHTDIADPQGGVAVVVTSEGRPDTVLLLEVVDDRIQAVHLLANPEKLEALTDVARVGTPLGLRWQPPGGA